MDFKVWLRGPALAGTSNPGVNRLVPGGVGRNIAENLARLGQPTRLLSVVGRDALGEELLRATGEAGVETTLTLRTQAATGTYAAVLDEGGELLLGVADMASLEALTPDELDARQEVLAEVAWVVADGNLPPATLGHLLSLCGGYGVPVALEPVSVPKASALRPVLQGAPPPHTLTPNRAELSALAGRPAGDPLPDDPDALAAAAAPWLARGVQAVWVRRGAAGSLLCLPGETLAFAALPARVAEVTGAGDAMLAAYLDALLLGQSLPEAVRLAHAAAALTIESPLTVWPGLTRAAVQARADRANAPQGD